MPTIEQLVSLHKAQCCECGNKKDTVTCVICDDDVCLDCYRDHFKWEYYIKHTGGIRVGSS